MQIHEWVFRSHHFSEKDGPAFTEVVDTGLIDSLLKASKFLFKFLFCHQFGAARIISVTSFRM